MSSGPLSNSEGDSGPRPSQNDVTALLQEAQQSVSGAGDRLLELVYEQLRATAGSYFRNQAVDHTLQPTALVHEAYIKLIGHPEKNWESRAHFCAVASTAMRHILRDHARAKRAAKRGGERQRSPLTQIATPTSATPIDLLALEEAMTALGQMDERGARVVELRYFGGLTNKEVAEVLEVPLRSVERSWRRSRAWIKAKLADEEELSEGSR